MGVYLTNALTGWEPPKGPKQDIMYFAELEEERDAAEHVKREKKILVVLGNPPYNAFAGVSPEEEQGLVELYKGVYFTEKKSKRGHPQKRVRHYRLSDPVSRGGWGTKKFNLDDFYIRFFRLAERRIAEMSGRGVVSFISNHSWISEPSFVILRQHLLESFDKFWVENLHGNRKISEYAPDGRTSETIFAISGFSVGIRQGVATSLWVKTGKARTTGATVRFRDDLHAAKAEERRQQLLDSLKTRRFDAAYTLASPCPENRYSFRPESVAAHYTEWPRMLDLCDVTPITGFKENRGFTLLDVDRDSLSQRMRAYCDPGISWEDLKASGHGLTRDAARFDATKARDKLLKSESFSPERLRRYVLRPFETRWCYYTPIRPIWNEPRPSLYIHLFEGNGCVVTRPDRTADPEGVPFYFVRTLADFDFMRGHSYHFPLRINPVAATGADQSRLFSADNPHANLSKSAREYLAKLGSDDPDGNAKTAGLLWLHALAVGYSPAYRTENADGIRRGWPRIPLPANRAALEASAALGEQVAALLDTEANVPGVTNGKIAPVFKTIALITKTGGGQLDAGGSDLAVTAGWGHAGKAGAIMPGRGQLQQRAYNEAEANAIDAEAAARGMSAKDARRLLGDETCDMYLNGTAYWRNVPAAVWDYHIGGYQVIKKWLSYREEDILGRALKPEEAREVMNTARRIAAIILLQPKLDENYHKVKAATYAWPSKT